MKAMRAVVFAQRGEPADVLTVDEISERQPAPGEVLVRMLAAPVNPSDLMFIRGIYGKQPQLPATPGFEGVGVVERSGGGLLGKLFTGKRVAVLNSPNGSWCERTVLPVRQAIPLSNAIPLEQAAMFFVNPATSFIMTRRVLKVPAGEWLLQTAAGSALGQMVVRLGKRFGFRTVNVVRRDAHVDPLKALGADEVVVFNPQHDPRELLAERLAPIAGERGVRYAIDPVGGETGSAVVDCLGHGARMLVYGTLADQPLCFSSRALMTPAARIEGFWLSNYMQALTLPAKLSLVGNVKRLLRDGTLNSQVGASFALDDVRDAVLAAEQPARDGKVLLQIGR